MHEFHETYSLTLALLLVLWFIQCKLVFLRLEKLHPITYESLGKPTLVTNNSILKIAKFAKYFFGGEWRTLNDLLLVIMFKSMVIVFSSCAVLLASYVYTAIIELL